MSSAKKTAGKPQRSAIADVVAREYTIHLHKRVRCLLHSEPANPMLASTDTTEKLQEHVGLTVCKVTWCFLQEESSSCHQGDQGLRHPGHGTIHPSPLQLTLPRWSTSSPGILVLGKNYFKAEFFLIESHLENMIA